MNVRETVNRYFHKYCTLNPPFHNLEQDQKRLQEKFGDTILLRWNCLIKRCQVWCRDRTGLYCVMNAEGHYDVAQIEKELIKRQQDKFPVRKIYDDIMKEWEYEREQKIKAAVEPTVEAFAMHKVGKVTASGKGLTNKIKKLNE